MVEIKVFDLFWCVLTLVFILFQVLAHLSFISEHCVCLSDVATHEQVEQLLRMCVMPMKGGFCHWGGAWTVHSLTSLLQDLLQGLRNTLCFILVVLTFFNMIHFTLILCLLSINQ